MNISRISLLLLLAATLWSCNPYKRAHKPLIGVVVDKRTGATEGQGAPHDGTRSDVDEPADGNGGKHDDGTARLEIPSRMSHTDETLLYRTAYTTSYNSGTRLPNWVAWHLTADHTTGTHSRHGVVFTEDEDVPAPRAATKDYSHSGYDRGHMCPAGDNKWSGAAQKESFLMTNICPQDHKLNIGGWNTLENRCREWAEKFGDIYIVAGPLFRGDHHKTIGKAEVSVPEAFFKVVLCMDGTPSAVGFVYDNSASDMPLRTYAVTVDEVEKLTGIDFFPSLPDDVEKKVEAEIGTVFF